MDLGLSDKGLCSEMILYSDTEVQHKQYLCSELAAGLKLNKSIFHMYAHRLIDIKILKKTVQT